MDPSGNLVNFYTHDRAGAVTKIGPLAGSYSYLATTTTCVPLVDASGSTIGLLNAAQVNLGPVTTYSYDPSGTRSVSGTPSNWPFPAGGAEQIIS